MRDLVVREAMTTMARDAAKRFFELIQGGAEIPYDVREAGGDGSPLPQYVPLTERFVREHAAGLRELDSFGAACATLESSELAGPYLELLGIPVPPEARRRAELASVVFLCRLWTDCSDFSISDERLSATIEELEAGGETDADAIEVIVPLRGLQMPVPRLDMATATIVRADTVEVPLEARAPEGTATAGWEPTFLAVAQVGVGAAEDEGEESSPDAGARGVEAFRQVITALRLFKAGGVGLGPHAWARTPGDRWRRIATGAGKPRAGGYRLTEDELDELVAFSRALANRSTPFGRPANGRPGLAGALARAISRFDAGLERHAVLEALNDYLLATRFLLEGGGPADLGLSMRVAALCAEPDQRGETKAVVDRALALERSLWTGEPAAAGEGVPTPAETVGTVEELARAILRDAACGHLGSDLRATADEILLADGLAIGDGAAEQRGATAEWDPPDDEELASEWLIAAEGEEPEWGESDEDAEPDEDDLDEGEIPDADEMELPLEVPELTGRITVERKGDHQEENLFRQDEARQPDPEPTEEPAADRRQISARVAYLFPRPETTEWNVREVAYDRTRRAEVRELHASS